jgi:hypothetical protein
MAESIITKSTQEAAENDTLFGGGPTNKRPANPARWFHYFDTDIGYDVVWDGSAWRDGPRGPQGFDPQGNLGFQGFQGSGMQGAQGPAGFPGVSVPES